MTENTSTPEPGTYVKGDSRRVAHTRSVAVALVFDGYKRVGPELSLAPASEADENQADYRDLQAQAKELGIPANQSAEALEQAINEALADAMNDEGVTQ